MSLLLNGKISWFGFKLNLMTTEFKQVGLSRCTGGVLFKNGLFRL